MLEQSDFSQFLFQYHPQPMCIYDPGTLRFLAVNDALETRYGYCREELLSMRITDMFLPEDIPRLKKFVQEIVPGSQASTIWRHRTRSGEVFWTEINSHGIIYNGEMVRLVVVNDASERREAEVARRQAERNYQSIFENAVEGIFQTSPAGQYLSANPALARIYGYDSPEDLMTHLTDISQQLYVNPADRLRFAALMQAGDAVAGFEAQVYRKDHSVIWISEHARAVRDEQGGLLYYEGMVEDITERKAWQAERERLLQEALDRADRDPLTGLWNHRAFHKRLQDEAEKAIQENLSLAILVLDLDNFKFFNDAYGHAVGDDVLRLVAAALRECCRAGDVLARFGGDEFALLLPATPRERAERLAERLQNSLDAKGYQPSGADSTIPLSVSFGLAMLPDDGWDRLQVLEAADTRLMRAKSGGDGEKADRLRASLTSRVEGFSMLDALVAAVDNKDRYTRRHSEDVSTYSLQIARELGLDEKTQQTVVTAALLHDVGKIGVPDRVLRKPGRLTDEEFEAVRQHPVMGAIIVGAVSGLENTLDAIRHHHERWDGNGYPSGLAGRETPLLARLMAVADAFSAMTMDRPYRKGMRPGEALAVLEQGAGIQWDPQCVQAFRRACRTQSDRSFLSERLEYVPSQPDTTLFPEPSTIG
jgi:diguanylate cyclase (GGDEF)-like protein/PAS domain S-box-containing protein